MRLLQTGQPLQRNENFLSSLFRRCHQWNTQETRAICGTCVPHVPSLSSREHAGDSCHMWHLCCTCSVAVISGTRRRLVPYVGPVLHMFRRCHQCNTQETRAVCGTCVAHVPSLSSAEHARDSCHMWDLCCTCSVAVINGTRRRLVPYVAPVLHMFRRCHQRNTQETRAICGTCVAHVPSLSSREHAGNSCHMWHLFHMFRHCRQWNTQETRAICGTCVPHVPSLPSVEHAGDSCHMWHLCSTCSVAVISGTRRRLVPYVTPVFHMFRRCHQWNTQETRAICGTCVPHVPSLS
jgi:hypothetical protein